MKKTFKLVLAAMLALLVFVSCENKTDVSNKTALDYLAGKSIATSLELNLDDMELDEEDLMYITSMYLPLPIAFDANGTVTTKYVDILDFTQKLMEWFTRHHSNKNIGTMIQN